MADKEFVDGMAFKGPREGAPDFVIGSLSIRVGDFNEWFAKWQDAHPGEAWINIDVLTGRSGKSYCALNTYKKLGMTEKPAALEEPRDVIDDSQIPF